MLVQGLSLDKQIGFGIGAQATAIAVIVFGNKLDDRAFLARNPACSSLCVDLIIFRYVLVFTQDQRRETISTPPFDDDGLFFGHQALRDFVRSEEHTSELQAL